MIIKIFKADLQPVVDELSQIRHLLEELVQATNPIPDSWTNENDGSYVLYHNEEREIVEQQLRKMGKTYKERKQ